MQASFESYFANRPVILAPMEDVTDAIYRRLCRSVGADLCVTEFVNVEGLLRGCRKAHHKIRIAPDDQPTAIQIYGSDPERLAEAAEVAEAAGPSFLDINCGCWVPKIARRGAGAGWLKNPTAMVEMAKMVVSRVALPVTVKTRIGFGAETEMPIIDLARRLEDAGVRALTLHCRTANMGHSGRADWAWARRAREVVSIPVIVNGDIDSGEAAKRALEETGCAGVMVGRHAIEHPWIFREARAMLDRGEDLALPSMEERLDLCRRLLRERWELRGRVNSTRRHLGGFIKGLPGAAGLRRTLFEDHTLEGNLAILDRYQSGTDSYAAA